MPRTTALSQAEVYAAIEGLLGAGQYPTAARVRDALDGRGSPVVLQRFLASWYADHGAIALGRARAAAAAGGAKALRSQIESITTAALTQYDRELAERDQALAARAATLDAREADLLARENRHIAVEHAQEALLATLLTAAAAAATALQAEQGRREAALEDARAARETLAVRDQEAAALRKDARRLEVTRAELAAARGNQQELRDRVVELTAQLARQHGQIEAAQAEAAHARRRAETVEDDLAQARVALAEALQHAQAADGRLAATQDALERATDGQEGREQQLRAAITAADAAAAALREALATGQAATVAEIRQISDRLGALPAQLDAVVRSAVAETTPRDGPPPSKAARRGR